VSFEVEIKKYKGIKRAISFGCGIKDKIKFNF